MSTGSRERWLALWDDHPYRDDFAGVARGFVLEVDGSIVGTISTLWAKYCFMGREWRVGIAGNAAVDHSHRSGSIRLFGEQLLQPGIDLYVNGSASATASKIMEALKVCRIPQADNDVCLLWAANGHRVAQAGLARRRVPLARVAAWPVGAGLRVATSVKLRRAGRAGYPVSVCAEFSDEFDRLWALLRRDSTRLLGFRDSAMLRWRYAHHIGAGAAVLLTVRRDGSLAGYAILVRRHHARAGVGAYGVHDFQCVDEDPDLAASLLSAAVSEARRASLDVVEWMGFSGFKRAIAERSCLLRYHLEYWQAYYHARDGGLKEALKSPTPWDFSPYDSD